MPIGCRRRGKVVVANKRWRSNRVRRMRGMKGRVVDVVMVRV